ncbi:MAG: GGDEF domain-containing protein [Gammaproteobacteria bacterium]|nr:GGDEF domain-containing protein [Gammaproteobacteria bacterium]
MNAEIKPMPVLSSVNGDTKNNNKSPSAIYGLLLALTVIITVSEFLLFLSFEFGLRQFLYLGAIAVPLLIEAANKHLQLAIVQKLLPHIAFVGVFSVFSLQLFLDINAYNLVPVIGLILLIVWYSKLSGKSHWVALSASLVMSISLVLFSGIPIESVLANSLLVFSPVVYFTWQALFKDNQVKQTASNGLDVLTTSLSLTTDDAMAQLESEAGSDWPRVLRELQNELKNITDVDRLFKTMLLFMSGAIEVDAAAVGMIQERSIKKIARIGDDELLGASDLQWTGDRIKCLISAGGEITDNAKAGEISRLDIPLYTNNKVQGIVTLFRRKAFKLPETHLASAIVTQSMLVLRLARLQDEIRKSSTGRTGTNGDKTLFSREQFIEKSRGYIEKLNTPRVFSLLIIEIDKFEDQVEKHGHNVKTAVYKKISSLIMSELKEADLMGRYGNDGFIVLLNETDLLDAKKIAETIRDKVVMAKHSMADDVISLTVSIGLTTTSEELDDMPSLIRKADMGLFVAKESGYNSVKVSL